jgi:hypothetical protein
MDVSANKTRRLPGLFFRYGIFFITAASCNTSTRSEAKTTDDGRLLQAYEVLHQRLQTVTEQDNAYAGLLHTPVTTAELDEKSGKIIQAEMALQRTVDSLQQTFSNAHTKVQAEKLYQVTSYFKALLQSRRLLSDMRMALSVESDDSTTTHRMLMRLQADLRQRDEKIAALEKMAGATTTTKKQEPPSKNENTEQLRQRNQALQESLKAMEAKYFTVGRNYLLLQKEHERTLNELTALRKANGEK